jgi:molybdopterin molybdotransferase
VITVEEALDRILARIEVRGNERVDLLRALGRVLAEPIVADRDIPPWPNSSMDGYAVRSADTLAASTANGVALRVAGRVAAGAVAARPLGAGEAFRIFTGAPLPDGSDAVIPQEDVRAEGDTVFLTEPAAAGAYVRRRGEDLRTGDTVLPPGRQLMAADLGLIATLGRHQVRVIRRPRVAILSTGDEIVDLGGTIGAGQIPNSNTYSLMAQVDEAGGEPVNLGVARDALPDIEARVRAGLSCDMIVSSAGVSVGDHDFVKEALVHLGAEQHLWLVNMRPGKPITFATIPAAAKSTIPVFGLPGNPVSAMVTFELFVRPALRRMAGHSQLQRPMLRARALAAIHNPGPRRAYLRVTLAPVEGGYGARLTGEQGSGILKSMATADGLAVVPGNTTIDAGQAVEVIVLRVYSTPFL